MAGSPPDMRQLVQQLGPHPASELLLDLARESGRQAWWVAAIVLAGAGSQRRGIAAARRLLDSGFASPPALARAAPSELTGRLEAIGEPRALAVAARLAGSGHRLAQRWEGSLEVLARSCDDLEELGSRLAGLAPGVGTATVLRFLRPLRASLPGAAQTPLAPAARAAALHLGWISAGDDEEGGPDALLRRWRESAPGVAFRDLEAALERLGGRACLRERPERCPLGTACPRAGQESDSG